MIRRRRPLPEWVNELMKELTRPPYYFQNPADEPAPSSSTSPASHHAGHSDKPTQPSRSGQSKSKNFRVPEPTEKSRTETEHVSQGGKARDIVTAAAANVAEPSVPENIPVTTNWQMVFRKSGYPVSAAKSYGWTVKKAQVTRNLMRVHVGKGSFAFKHTDLPPARVRFIQDAFDFVHQQGFQQMVPFLSTNNQHPYIVHKNKVFYATRWLHGQPANFSSVTQVGKVAELLATFHELSRGFEGSSYTPPMEFQLNRMLRRRTEDLRALLAIAQTKREPDNFDKSLTRISTSLKESAEESIRLIEDSGCQSFIAEDEEIPGLCHLDVIPENFIFTPQHEMIAIDFDLSTYAPRALDLAHLLRRALQRQQWQTDVAYTCFSAYQSVRPLVGEEYTLIQALMTFPYRAWRVANLHYRGGSEPGQLDEIDECSVEEDRRRAFLNSFAHQIQR